MTKPVTKECIECHKEFTTTNDSAKCYACTLEEVTGGFPPEEGDFNTASIRSGTLSEEERRNLQTDLESVETGSSIQYAYDEEDERPYWEDWFDEDDDWEFDEEQDARWGHEG